MKMITLYVGNDNEAGKVRTLVRFPPGVEAAEAFTTFTHAGDGVWVNHSAEAGPRWIAGEDEELVNALAAHYGCEVRLPLPGGERNEFPEEVEIINES
jgi:hypothetical protein